MAVDTLTFIRKPLYVEAIRITAVNFDDVVAWCEGEVLQDEVSGKGTTKKYIKVRVHNPKNVRQTKAFVGDWLLYTERGYKVYTNKAFHASFDEVKEIKSISQAIEELRDEGVSNGSLKETQLAPGITQTVVQPATYPPVADQIRKLHDAGQSDSQIALELGIDVGQVQWITQASSSPAMALARQTIEADGGTLEPATPQAIFDVMKTQSFDTAEAPSVQVHSVGVVPANPDPVHGVGEIQTVEDVPQQETIVPAAAEGKRVLSIAEQKQLTVNEVHELLKSGEAILVQDLPEAS